jgi:hypothetical protein
MTNNARPRGSSGRIRRPLARLGGGPAPHARRLWVRRGPAADITCQAVLRGTPIGAVVMDLSAGGAGLALSLPLEKRSGLTLRLFNHRCLYSLTLEAVVVWCTTGKERGSFRAGCEFVPPLPLDHLLPLLS